MMEHFNAIEALAEQIVAILDLMQGCDESTDIRSIHSAAEQCITMLYDLIYEVGGVREDLKEKANEQKCE